MVTDGGAEPNYISTGGPQHGGPGNLHSGELVDRGWVAQDANETISFQVRKVLAEFAFARSITLGKVNLLGTNFRLVFWLH